MINTKKVLELMGNSRELRNFYQELRKLKGHKVVDIIPFIENPIYRGFYLKFSNGKYLTAVDERFGDNALEILEITNFKKSINRTREFMRKVEQEVKQAKKEDEKQ